MRPLEITIGAHGGGAIFTEFLEQRADGGERELVAKSSPVIGARFAVSPRMGLKVEIDRATVGNPFDGENAYRVGRDTFDEPSTVGILRLHGGLSYTL